MDMVMDVDKEVDMDMKADNYRTFRHLIIRYQTEKIDIFLARYGG